VEDGVPKACNAGDTMLAPGVSLGKTDQEREPAKLAAQTPCQAPAASQCARTESNSKRNTCGPDRQNGEAFCAARFAGSLLLLGFPRLTPGA